MVQPMIEPPEASAVDASAAVEVVDPMIDSPALVKVVFVTVVVLVLELLRVAFLDHIMMDSPGLGLELVAVVAVDLTIDSPEVVLKLARVAVGDQILAALVLVLDLFVAEVIEGNA